MSGVLGAGRSPMAATPLVALSTFSSFWAFAVMIELGAWQVRTAFALAVVGLVIMIVRLVSRSRLLPSLAGAVAALLVAVPLYAVGEDGETFAIPTVEAVKALYGTLSRGAEYAATTVAPAVVTPELAALLSVAVLAFFLAAEHLAVSWRMVASAGLILLVPWIPAVILQHRVSALALGIAIGSWMLALAVSRSNAPAERGVSLPSALLATVSALLLLALAAPSALGGNGWGVIGRINTPDLFEGGATRLNLELDLRNSLTTNSQTPVFAYNSTGKSPDAFRLYTLADFDGTGWDREEPDVTTRPASSGLLWPTAVDGWAEANRTRLDLVMLSLAEKNLPVPVAPRTVDVDSGWFYDSATDEIVGDGKSTLNLAYSIVADFEYHKASVLRAADGLVASGDASDVTDAKYLEIPPALDLPRVLSLTRSIVGVTTDRYDSALAIQSYLRNTNNFTYDTAVSPSGGDAVSSFLDARSGFCVQFATTMVMMLRSIGIPARLGVGFLPGRFQSDNTYVVRGADAHAWPEVYFPGHGWVRFEPTPAVQSGSPPSWADPYAGQVPVPRSILEGGSLPVGPQPIDGGGESGSGTTGSPIQASGIPLWAATVAIAIVLLLLAGAYVWWRRRSPGGRRSYHGPEAAWQRLRDRIGDLAWPTSATPLEATAHVLRGIRMSAGRPAREEPEAALRSLSGAVSDHRYAPAGSEIPQEQLHAWVDEIVEEIEALGEPTDRPVRAGARTAPRGES